MASIGDAIVNIGQKELLIEYSRKPGGDMRTGIEQAAARYIVKLTIILSLH